MKKKVRPTPETLEGVLKALGAGAGEGEWEKTWDARQKALEAIFGKSGPEVFHALMPFSLGGFADVLEFRRLPGGVAYVTADMTGGDSGQKPNAQGNYELVICTRKASPNAAEAISDLARVTLQRALQPGQVLDRAGEPDSPFDALLFTEWPSKKKFRFEGKEWGLLLCIGITPEDVSFARKHRTGALLTRLKRAGSFPFSTFRPPQRLPCAILDQIPARVSASHHKGLTPALLAALNRSLAEARGKVSASHREWGFGAHEGWGMSQETGRTAFAMPGGARITCPAQIIGSWSPGDGTWEWAWNNPHVDKKLKHDSEIARRYATKQRFSVLTRGRLKASERLAWAFTALAASQSQAPGVFVGETDDLKVFMTLGKPRPAPSTGLRPAPSSTRRP